MTSRRRRAALAAAALNRQRARRVEVPAAHDPDQLLWVARSVLEVSKQFGFGSPTSEEYAVAGWRTAIADRAQDFEGGTIYLDSATGGAGFLSWQVPGMTASSRRTSRRGTPSSPGGGYLDHLNADRPASGT